MYVLVKRQLTIFLNLLNVMSVGYSAHSSTFNTKDKMNF